MKSNTETQEYIDRIEAACAARGLDPVKTTDLLAPLRAQVRAYYGDDLSALVSKAIAAQLHGVLREGFRYDRPVTYKPCGGAPVGYTDVRALFEHEDRATALSPEAVAAAVIEVTPETGAGGDTGTGTDTGEAPEPYYECTEVDEMVEIYAKHAPLVRAGLGLIAAHGNAVAVMPAAEVMLGGAEIIAAPSADEIKETIYTERRYADLIRCRALSVEVY